MANSEDVVCFLTRFQELRRLVGDDPSTIESRSPSDAALRAACDEVSAAAMTLEWAEQSGQDLFAAPVAPEFVAAWRDYERRFAVPVAGVYLRGLGVDLGNAPVDADRFELRWTNAHEEAVKAAQAILAALDFADYWLSVSGRDEETVSQIERGLREGRALVFGPTQRVVDVLRRRSLIPFVLVPRHIANRYGSNDPISLLEHLRQAQQAFVAGAPLAAVALLRSIIEMALKKHYASQGDDLASLINNCTRLPPSVSKTSLHRIRDLANGVLHSKNKGIPARAKLERTVIEMLVVVRRLIELAP